MSLTLEEYALIENESKKRWLEKSARRAQALRVEASFFRNDAVPMRQHLIFWLLFHQGKSNR
ncbi:MAG: hypothetical protein EPN39_11050 [Chitinophagaceae bacterium]|nr:MAG: hypothetical protein EPN39_11050 [Chitinophagaceae bacterium]